MDLPPRNQRHQYLRYEGLQYIDDDIADFKMILARIYSREGQSVFTSQAWRRLFDIRGPLFQLGGARRCMSWRQFILALRLRTDEEMQSARFGAS
ncbi:hypothetical protein Tco_1206985, partial [Tanacetum coccineum]